MKSEPLKSETFVPRNPAILQMTSLNFYLQ